MGTVVSIQIWRVWALSTTFALENEAKEGNGHRSLLFCTYVSLWLLRPKFSK